MINTKRKALEAQLRAQLRALPTAEYVRLVIDGDGLLADELGKLMCADCPVVRDTGVCPCEEVDDFCNADLAKWLDGECIDAQPIARAVKAAVEVMKDGDGA